MITLKPHEFRELVNHIRHVTIDYMYKIPSDTDALRHWLKCQEVLCKLSEKDVHYINCVCKAYYTKAQLCERISSALKYVGVTYA